MWFNVGDQHVRRIEKMNATKIIAVILIAAGTLGLAYGGFSYTKESHEVKVGPIDLSVQEKKRVDVPVWAGAAAIVIGAGLLLFKNK
jgi:TRAP-type C4-dicarboxylate transport system permease small subunit